MSDPWAPISAEPVSSLPVDAPEASSTRKMLLAAVGSAIAALLLALLLWSLAADNSPAFTNGPASDSGGSGESAGAVEDEPEADQGDQADQADDEPGASGEEDGVAGSGSAEFDALIDDLSTFVENERQLEFLESVNVQRLDDDAFVARYTALVEESVEDDREELEIYTGVNQALGILPDDVTLLEATYAFGAAGVLGYYDPETKELVVRGSEVTVLLKTIIVHELVHAIDDQHFDLDRPEYDDRKDEVSTGFRAVVEGNARRVENAYKDTLSADELTQLAADELALSASVEVDFSKITFEFITLQLAPYELGEVLVDELDDLGGEEAINEALIDPPTTSEQVLKPEAYITLDPLEDVAPPPAAGDVVEDGVFGPLVFEVIFEPVVGDAGSQALEGWEGDWFVVWQDGPATCIRVDVLLDESGNVDDLVDVMDRWASTRDGRASAERTSDDLARLTACNR